MRLSAPIFRLKRQGKSLARAAGIPLHAALDRIARQEGFRSWSHLAARASTHRPARDILARLEPGDVVLLGARPGHGKTMLGLELLATAARSGRHGYFFTLEYSADDARDRLRAVDTDFGSIPDAITIDASDGICAAHIMARMRTAPHGAVAVIDYLQLLDQRRRNPALSVQMTELKAFAASAGVIFVMISQIDRSFESAAKPLPDLSDVRLPNPLDLALFTKTCFLHDGDIRLEPSA